MSRKIQNLERKIENRRIDLLILDDNVELLNTIDDFSKVKYNFSSFCFEKGTPAIDYINSINKNSLLPLGYLIDMNILTEQTSTENLTNLLIQKNANLDNFSFITGHYSQHDESLVKKTKMYKPIIKTGIEFYKNLDEFFDKIAQKKLSLIPTKKGNRENDLYLYENFRQKSENRNFQVQYC